MLRELFHAALVAMNTTALAQFRLRPQVVQQAALVVVTDRIHHVLVDLSWRLRAAATSMILRPSAAAATGAARPPTGWR